MVRCDTVWQVRFGSAGWVGVWLGGIWYGRFGKGGTA